MKPASPSDPRPSYQLTICADREELIRQAAEELIRLARKAVSTAPYWTLALSGGNTPKYVYRRLAEAGYRERLPWEKARIFLGDERFVPPDHPDSNYAMAHKALLSSVGILAEQIYPVPTEGLEPSAAAARYEATIRDCFQLGEGEWPRFDVMLMGLGPDGHTASLFPHTAALGEERRLVVANRVEKLDTDRITLTYPVINASATILFLVSGDSKAEALYQILEGEYDPERLPAQRVQATDGDLHFMVDQEAAGRLSKR